MTERISSTSFHSNLSCHILFHSPAVLGLKQEIHSNPYRLIHIATIPKLIPELIFIQKTHHDEGIKMDRHGRNSRGDSVIKGFFLSKEKFLALLFLYESHAKIIRFDSSHSECTYTLFHPL